MKSDPAQLNMLDGVPMIRAARLVGENGVAQRKWRAATQSSSGGAASPARVLTALEAARYLNLSIATLKLWRSKKIGPVFVKRGARLIGYLPSDLDAYLKSDR